MNFKCSGSREKEREDSYMVPRKRRKLQKISTLVLVVAVDRGLLDVLPSFICAIAVDGGLSHVLPSFICTEWILPTIFDVPTPLATPAYLRDEQESANGLSVDTQGDC